MALLEEALVQIQKTCQGKLLFQVVLILSVDQLSSIFKHLCSPFYQDKSIVNIVNIINLFWWLSSQWAEETFPARMLLSSYQSIDPTSR